MDKAREYPMTENLSVNRAAYVRRLEKILWYIEHNLDANLNVDTLSTVAALSKFHFHRQFSAMFKISVHRYVQLARLKRASYQLAFRPARGILQIATDSGFEGPEAFARAFRKTFGQSPTDFRNNPDWPAWRSVLSAVMEVRTMHLKNSFTTKDVCVAQVEEVPVAMMLHEGDPKLLGDTIRQFINWRKQNGLSPQKSLTFNLFYDDPNTTPPEMFRLGLCVSMNGEIAPTALAISKTVIPAGRCAILRHVGSDDTLGNSLRFLYEEWLPES